MELKAVECSSIMNHCLPIHLTLCARAITTALRRAENSSRNLLICTTADVEDKVLSYRGDVCPGRARRATFLLTIPTLAPDLPSHGEAPQVNHVGLHTFPTKHGAE